MKLQKVSQSASSFAGISFVHEEFNKCGLLQLIDEQLGKRNASGYGHGELFRTWFEIFFCGGEVAEDVQEHLRSTLESMPGNRVAAPDTLLREPKELATENTIATSSSGKKYRFNINEKMNGLNIKSLLLTGQLEKGKKYDLDYDNQIIEHEKWDAKRTYKHTTGYFAGIGSIGNRIVYVENRDGNANVKAAQGETLARMFGQLRNNGITTNRSRMDAGSYAKDIVDTVSKNCDLFCIRANKSESEMERISRISEWKKVEIKCKTYEVASIPFKRFFEERDYRLVVMREESDEKQIIEYCNTHGASGKLFDIQNNDFGWKRLPTSEMKSNTVFLIITAMMKNFHDYFIKKGAEVFKDIPSTSDIQM